MTGYRPRLADARLERVLRVFPAVSIVGPRASGKTTSAIRVSTSAVRLDRPDMAAIFTADVDAALDGRPRPLLLDEWQEVPAVLAAVKRAVDVNDSAGQFVLTGSVNAELDANAWPGTGRIIRLSLGVMTQREQRGLAEVRPSLRQILSGDIRLPTDIPTLPDYVDLVARGGFPEVVELDDHRDRRLWFDSYVEQLVTRDAARIGAGRDAARLRRYLQAWALNAAGIVDDVTIYSAAGIDRRTHVAYEQLLDHLFVAETVPAWTSNRLKRLSLAPKRYLSDNGLWCSAGRIGPADIMASADLLGRALDQLVFNEVRLHAAADDERCTLSHIRTAGGRQEVDLVAEFDGGNVVGIEVKATSAPTIRDARHLEWMRDHLGNSFAAGVVFHTGPSAFELSERILALPICAFWADLI